MDGDEDPCAHKKKRAHDGRDESVDLKQQFQELAKYNEALLRRCDLADRKVDYLEKENSKLRETLEDLISKEELRSKAIVNGEEEEDDDDDSVQFSDNEMQTEVEGANLKQDVSKKSSCLVKIGQVKQTEKMQVALRNLRRRKVMTPLVAVNK